MNNLTPGRRAAWKVYLRGTWRITEIIDHELKKQYSIALADYSVLLELSHADEQGLRPRTLAEQVVFSPSRLTHTLTRLMKRGLIKRNMCRCDARGSYITLTREGSKLYEAAKATYEQVIRHLALDSLQDDEVLALHNMFSKIDRRLNEIAKTSRQPENE